jgi:hypothetical protein
MDHLLYSYAHFLNNQRLEIKQKINEFIRAVNLIGIYF